MSKKDNLEIVKKILSGYTSARAEEPSLKYFAEDVEWTILGAYQDPFVGRYRGLKQVKEVFEVFNQTTELLSYEPQEYFTNENESRVVVIGKEKIRFKKSDRVVEGTFVSMFTLRDGKVVEHSVMYAYP